MIARSLRWRLLAGAVAAIFAALMVAWLFMTVLFERHLERRLQADLTRDALGLVATLALDPSGQPVIETPPTDARLQKPAGGYYWQVTSADGALRSRSLWDATLVQPVERASDQWTLRRAAGPFDEPLVLLERALVVNADFPAVFVQLAQDTRPLATARAEFGRELGAFLVLLWLVLSAAAWLQVTLGLRPLRTIRGDLAALRDNAQARLPASNVREIQPLADAINALAGAREADLVRARQRAADLAHGLKTPLAALRALVRRARGAGADEASDGMDRAIGAIGATIDAELARSRVAAVGHAGGHQVDARACVEALVTVLEHTAKGGELAFAIEMHADLHLGMPPETLSEILGAVLENAVRHARRQVRMRADASGQGVAITIEDDGPGIAEARVGEALLRGARLDQSGPGSGLGLAIARELVEATGGTIHLDASPLGGLRVAFAWLHNSVTPT